MTVPDTPMPSVARQALAKYLDVLKYERQLSEHTLKAYRRDIEKLFDFLDQRGVLLWQGISAHHVRLFAASLNSQGMNANSIKRILSSGRGLANYLIRTGVLKNNPFDDVRAPKGAKRLPKTLSVDQIVALVELDVNDPLSYRDKAILELFYSSGLRLGELCGLNLNDLDLSESVMRVRGKGSKERDLPIGKQANQAIREWLMQRNTLPLKDFQALFISKLGNRISPRNVQARVKYWAKRQALDVNVSPHMLRHSFASHVLESSGELRAVQELLGHSNISTTQIYTHLDFQHLAQVYDDAHPRARGKKRAASEQTDRSSSTHDVKSSDEHDTT